MTPAVGSRVRIARDETRYPSRGTWVQFRGRVGTVVEISLGEYGVVFGKARLDGRGGQREPVTWFREHEVRALDFTAAHRATNAAPVSVAAGERV